MLHLEHFLKIRKCFQGRCEALIILLGYTSDSSQQQNHRQWGHFSEDLSVAGVSSEKQLHSPFLLEIRLHWEEQVKCVAEEVRAHMRSPHLGQLCHVLAVFWAHRISITFHLKLLQKFSFFWSQLYPQCSAQTHDPEIKSYTLYRQS